MKRFLFAIIGFALTLPTFAQYGSPINSVYTADHNIYYGLRLGLALSSINSDDKYLDGGSVQSGLNVGLIIGFQLSPMSPVYLESGLVYTEKGGKGRIDGAKFTYDLNYLELPIIAKYKYYVDDDLSIQPFGGAYIAYGVGGKVKNFGHTKEDRATYSSFSEDFFKRFDGGLRIGCGMEFQMLYVEMSYDFGLANICHSDFDSSHTGCFNINCGVNF